MRHAIDEFVATHPHGWWWHTEEWMRYCEAARGGSARHVTVRDPDGLRVWMPIIVEGGVAQCDGNPLPIPLLRTFSDWIHAALELRTYTGITRWRFRDSPLASVSGTDLYELDKAFHREGFKEVGWRTRLIDLTASETDLWRGVRKSYHSLIRGGEKRLRIESVADVEVFRQLHVASAGRETRPRATWSCMQRWLAVDRALLLVAYDQSEDTIRPVGAAYWIVYKQAAYYASASYLQDNVAHAVIWQSLLHLRDKCGVMKVEMGWQGHAQDEKGKNIEYFKRGWGGHDVPLPAWEKTV